MCKWTYIIKNGIIITAVEYLPGAINKEADFQSQNVRDSSKWKLNPFLFQNICYRWGTLDLNLFASRVSHPVPAYLSCKLDPYSKGRDAFHISWTHRQSYAFPPFFLIGLVLNKVEIDQATLISITPMWHARSWYPQLLQISMKDPLFLPKTPNLLISPNQGNHALVEKGSLKLLPETVFGKSYHQKD